MLRVPRAAGSMAKAICVDMAFSLAAETNRSPTSRQGKTRYYVSSDAEERRYDSLHRHVDGAVAFAPTSREVGLTLLTAAATLHVSPFRILLCECADAHPCC